MSIIENLEAMLAKGQDNALVRFSLGNAYLNAGDARTAAKHLSIAVDKDPHYSAAWKLLGKALTHLNQVEEAVRVYARGIEVAEKKGDLQAAKEMRIFQKRLQKKLSSSNS